MVKGECNLVEPMQTMQHAMSNMHRSDWRVYFDTLGRLGDGSTPRDPPIKESFFFGCKRILDDLVLWFLA